MENSLNILDIYIRTYSCCESDVTESSGYGPAWQHLSVFLTYGDTDQIITIFAVNSSLSDILSTTSEMPLLTGCSVNVVV